MRRSRLARVPIVCVGCTVWLWLVVPRGVLFQELAAAQETDAATLAGRVVAADSGRPLGRATVTLSRAGRVLRVATTEPDGRYAFTTLPAGRYTLVASKTGYVRLEYGQRRAFETGRPVSVSAGQHLENVNVLLPRGAVITARVLDDRSAPVVGARVRAMRYRYRPDGEAYLADASLEFPFRFTDDRGEVRLHGLMPGEYVLSASTPASSPEAGLDSGLATTFYPGTLSAAEAQPLSLGIGEEVVAQMPLLAVQLSRISGTVTDSAGRPAAGASLEVTTYEGSAQWSRGSGRAGDDGSFAIGGVPPGGHWLVADHPSTGEFAALPVIASGGDIPGLRLVLGRGATVTGTVVVADGTLPDRRVRVLLHQAGPAQPIGGQASSDPVVGDGRFAIAGAMGRVLFDASGADGFELLSVTMNGRDITDEPIELPPGDTLSGVTIALSTGFPRLIGTVSDAQGEAVRDYAVVVQPAEALEPTAAARRVHLLRPDSTGRFESPGLRPGRYVATALEAVEQGRQYAPEFRARLRERGQAFQIDGPENVTLSLRLSTGL